MNKLLVIILIVTLHCGCSKSKKDDLIIPSSVSRVSVGAIRWDGYYGGPVTTDEEKMLGPSQFQERAPFFSKILDDSTISINGNLAATMSKEIEYAVQSGIDYWAFLAYPWFSDQYSQDITLSTAATLYLNSPDMKKINFCWIVGGHLYWNGRWDKYMAHRALETCRMSNYQTVLDGRPLIYFFEEGIIATEANIVTCKSRLEKLSNALVAAGGKAPYYVFMGWNTSDWDKAKRAGFDAWSFYAGGGSGKYADAAQSVKQVRWVQPTSLGIPTVPVVSAGWNALPRIEYREKYGPTSYWGPDSYTSAKRSECGDLPTADELAAHLKDAMNFTANNSLCDAKTCIMYAWNEHSEGGWLCPTILKRGGIDKSRVEAVGSVLKNRDLTK